FLAGMEEGILPHSQSLDANDDIEEERRLCYVGMTRAREQLYCLHSLERRVHGQFREQSPSPFLSEIPEEVKEETRTGRWASRPTPAAPRRPRVGSPLPRAGGGGREPGRGGGEGGAAGVMSFFKDAPVKFDPTAIHAATAKSETKADLKRGQRVRHEQFGDGTILTMEGSGPDAKLTVYFDRAGSKKFIAKYAKLIRI